MPINKRIKAAFLFENGNLAVIDTAGNQVGELQGPYSIEKHQRILIEAVSGCEMNGFEILPKGFIAHANELADYCIKNDLNYDDLEK